MTYDSPSCRVPSLSTLHGFLLVFGRPFPQSCAYVDGIYICQLYITLRGNQACVCTIWKPDNIFIVCVSDDHLLTLYKLLPLNPTLSPYLSTFIY
jgi:hypothetical protein